jgi:hypothetical protein
MDIVIKQIVTSEDETNEHREKTLMMKEDKRDKLIRRKEREERELKEKRILEDRIKASKLSTRVKAGLEKTIVYVVKPLVPTKAGMVERLKEIGIDPGKKKRVLRLEAAWKIQRFYRQYLSRLVLEKKKEERQARMRDKAATVIQQLAIFRAAIKLAKSLVPTTFDKQYSKWRGCYYYRNLKTKELLLHKPFFLGPEEDLELPEDRWLRERKRRRELNPVTIEVAARMVQSVYRKKQCLKALRAKIHRTYEKHLDAKSGNYYYLFKKDKSVSWFKPGLLAGDDDIKTEEEKQSTAAVTIQHLFVMRREREKKKHIHLLFFQSQLVLGIRSEVRSSLTRQVT